jgi:Ca2+-transporting ATPase
LILVAASVLSFIFTSWVDGIAIAVAILLNTVIGFFMELKAVRSMEALRQMEQITAKVLRSGRLREIHAKQLVPGDLVAFEGGDIVSADMRLLETSKLQVDESMLTGESVPVTKQTEPVDENTPVSNRTDMLFKGTAITRGSGKAVVTAIGMDTELGRISSLVEESQDEFTPLEKRLGQLGRKLLWITLGVLIVVAALGIIRGKEMLLMIETAVALAVAAIPEGLPIVATIAMARGMMRMAQHNALVNRLAAVETLGGTNVIFTDKTGTLTENKMTVTNIILETGDISVKQRSSDNAGPFEKDGKSIDPADDGILKKALKISVLCNNASLDGQNDDGAVGDPLELALLVAADKAGLSRDQLLKQLPEEREEAFDPATKMMATFHKQNNRYFVAVKGAPEAVLQVCLKIRHQQKEQHFDEEQKKRWLKHNEKLAKDGLRILAVAYKETDSPDVQPYEQLTLVGLIGMIDPPRKDVKEAIGLCRDAGLKVVMVTGDQAHTALKVASEVGLTENDGEDTIQGDRIKPTEELSEQEKERFLKASVFARVSPEQKLDLVNIHQQAGSVVAMTGDGVNDAPSLRKADIGVAMGKRGTQVAREASDMILKDDLFATIVVAIEQGRIIFKNIRKFIVYLLSGNASEIMIVLVASLFNAPLPLLPLQILLLNVISDVFPALALGLGGQGADVMKDPPRDPREPILTRAHWSAVFGYGLLIAVPVLAAFALSLAWLKMDMTASVTVSFLTLAFARLWHIFNMRDRRTRFLKNEVVTNKFVWAALVLCTALLLAAVYLPGTSDVLTLTSPGLREWSLIIIFSLVPFVFGQLLKSIRDRHAASNTY